MTLTRGCVYTAIISEDVGEKLYLVVSNNRRNKALGTALVVRLTTSRKNDTIPTVVPLPDTEQFAGSRVLCDDITDMWDEEVVRRAGALSARAMSMVDSGLKAALELT